MIVDTEELLRLVSDREEIKASFPPEVVEDPEVMLKLHEPIERELDRLAGFVFHASSLVVVAGLEDCWAEESVPITDHASFTGKIRLLRELRFPHSPIDKAGPVPSLVFRTHDPVLATDITQGAALLFPYAALPLTEPHYLEVI